MKRSVTWLIALVALTASGCAALSAHLDRTKVQEAEVGGYRYRQPIEVVWPQLRQLLVEHGLRLGGKDAEARSGASGLFVDLTSVARETSPTARGGLRLETDWTNGGRRWRAEAWPDGGGCRVTLTKIAENLSHRGHDDWSARDYPLELELIRRLDPTGADRIDDLIDPPSTPRPAPATAPSPAPAAIPAPTNQPAAPAPGKSE